MASLLRRLAAGIVAGTAGTLAMDRLWYERYRADGGESSFADWQFSTGTRSFEEASAPGKMGQKLAGAVGIDLPDEAAGTTTNVMHFLTGVGYGVGHALLQGDRNVASAGLLTGTGAFLTSYAVMGAVGLYQPIWEYDPDTLIEDYSAHLLFGATTAVVHRLLAGSDD